MYLPLNEFLINKNIFKCNIDVQKAIGQRAIKVNGVIVYDFGFPLQINDVIYYKDYKFVVGR